MHRTNEATLSSITNNLEKLRECFGNWVNLSIESDCKVIVTSADTSIFKMGTHEVKLGELSENSSREVTQKYILEKKLKRDCVIFDLRFWVVTREPQKS